jgi:GT2 family glycosyltransferase
MLVSILIVNWNTCTFLQQCLQSIDSIVRNPDSTAAYETIVVDNASTDGSVRMVQERFPWVLMLENKHNAGFGRANNQALQLAKGDFLLLLNPDTVLQAGVVQNMVNYLHQNPTVGAVGPRILNSDQTPQVSISPKPGLFKEAWRLFHLDRLYPYSCYSQRRLESQEAFEVDVLKGACILLRSEIPRRIGLFDEQYFMYSEEVDLCWRIQQAGWQIHWLPSATVVHYGGQSTRQIADQMFLELYRNKIKFFRKHQGEVSARIYKSILFFAALIRWLPGKLLQNLPIGHRLGWGNLSHQYSMLIKALPQL